MEVSINEDTIISSESNLLPKATILVYGGEGSSIPHFHYKDKIIDACIMLHDNRYFTHGGHKGIISDGKTRKYLNKILEGICLNKKNINDDPNKPDIFGKMVWSGMVILYNYANGTSINSNPNDKPNYTSIKSYK